MRLTIGDWRFEIDVKRTRAYYEKLRGREISDPILRNHCAVMENHVSPRILRLMSRLGIVEHSGFRYAECLNTDWGVCYRCGAYLLFGRALHNTRVDSYKTIKRCDDPVIKMHGCCHVGSNKQSMIGSMEFVLSEYDGDNCLHEFKMFGDMDGNDVLLLRLDEPYLPWVIDEPCPVLSDKQARELDELEVFELARGMFTRLGARFEFHTPSQRMTALKRCINAFSHPGMGALLWNNFAHALNAYERPGNLIAAYIADTFENVITLTPDTIDECYDSLNAEGYTLVLGCGSMCVHVYGALLPLYDLDQFMAYDIYLFDDALTFCFVADDNYRIARRVCQ